MSAGTSDPWEEFRGVDPWKSEPSKDYPDPLPCAGDVVECPECGARFARLGWFTHYRRAHVEKSNSF